MLSYLVAISLGLFQGNQIRIQRVWVESMMLGREKKPPTIRQILAKDIQHICSNPLYLFLNHLVKQREHLFHLAAPDLVEV